MPKTTQGKYYTKFKDETLEEAINAHAIGYDSVMDAIDDTSTFEKQEPYQILNDNLEVVETIL